MYDSMLWMMQLYIWDFSGQTTQLLINDKARVPNDSPGQPGKEVVAVSILFSFYITFLKMFQVYGAPHGPRWLSSDGGILKLIHKPYNFKL